MTSIVLKATQFIKTLMDSNIRYILKNDKRVDVHYIRMYEIRIRLG